MKKMKLAILSILRIVIFAICSPALAEELDPVSPAEDAGELDSDVGGIANIPITPSPDPSKLKTFDAQQKASDGKFFDGIRNKMVNYFDQFDNGEITEQELADLIQNNISPNLATEEQQMAFVISEQKSDSTVMMIQSTYPPVEYGLGKLGLNSKEIKLFSDHPVWAAKTKNIANVASAEAEKRFSRYTLWQGNGDAFRHSFWNALMTKNINRDWAYQVGYAHENLNPGQKTIDLDIKMDIENNYRGRVDGTDWKSYGDSVVSDKIADSISNGKKVRIRSYTSGYAAPEDIVAGVKTKSEGKFIATSSGGRMR